MNNQQKPKQKPKITAIPDEILEEIELASVSDKSPYPVDDYWLLLAEWLDFAGYQAYLDVKNDRRDEFGNLIIEPAEFYTLMAAKRKLDSAKMIRAAEAGFIATGSLKTKNPHNTLKSLLKPLQEHVKADEE